MKVITFVSPYRNTNNYLIEISPKLFVGIDIGTLGLSPILEFLTENDGSLQAYFITHAHADHSIGIKEIYDYYKVPVYCSKECSNEINDARKNFSIYTDEIPTYAYNLPLEILEDGAEILIKQIPINAYHVPGHSPGCMVFGFGKTLFTGDFLMLKDKTPLNFPNSNKNDYYKSLQKILQIHNQFDIYFPGHGVSFHFINEIEHLQQTLL